MTTLSGPSDEDAGGGLQQSAQACGNVLMAGRDINIDYAGAPAFAVQEFVAPAPADLAELTRARQQPSVLLTARRQTIVFAGRTAEMTELRQWQGGPAACSVWAWHAPGGQGKTRLGQQLGRQSTAAGWRVGVASHQDAAPGDADARPLAKAWRWLPGSRRPLLLLVDYAERWPLHDLQRLLADCRQRAPKVRVLLLARSVHWWSTVAAELNRLGFTAGGDGHPRPLPALADDIPGRRQLFETACQRFTQIYQPDIPEQGWPGRWNPPGDLGDDSVYGITLGVHMAALAAVDAYARQTAPPGSAGDVSRYLLDRERSYWARLHGDAPDTVRAAARTVLLACLTGPQLPDGGIRLLELTGLASRPAGQKLLDAHDRCYPPSSTGTVLEPMYPDRLAEDFIALSLPASPAGEQIARSGDTDSWAATTLITTHRNPDDTVVFTPGPLTARTPDQRPPGHTSRILIFLAAAASRNQHVKGWLHTLLTADPALAVHAGGVALDAVVAYTSPALAETIYQLLPERSLDLDPAAAVLAQHLLDHTDNTLEQHAQHLGNLAFRLSNTGRRGQALALAEEATGIYRRLAEANPDAWLSDLAMSLTNLGDMLSDLGRREQALASTEEAVDLYRRLAEANADPYVPHLATALTNLGSMLSDLGRREQALASTEEAVAIRRRLAEVNPDAYLPGLASSLTNLGNMLSGLGRRKSAMTPAMQAVMLFRRLAEANPDAYLPDLAMSLTNLCLVLSGLGQHEKALTSAEEAVTIRRRLAKINPDAYESDLAMSLTNLAGVLTELKRGEQALASAEEAVTIYRRLAEGNPDAYEPDLAMSLTNLGGVFDGLERSEQAMVPAQEAVDLYRRLVETNPDAYEPDLAMSLTNLGAFLTKLKRGEQGLALAEEAVTIYRRLAKGNRDAYEPGLGRALSNLGSILSQLGRSEQAMVPAQEAVDLYRRLAETNPDAYEPVLAMTLTNLVRIMFGLERGDQAQTAVQEAVDLYRRLAETKPHFYLPGLAEALTRLGIVLAWQERWEQTPAEEAVAIYRQLAKGNPDAYLPDLARSLGAYAWVCVNAQENWPQALEAVTEAIGYYEPLAQQLPDAFAGYLSAAHDLRRQLDSASGNERDPG